jgi:hypothetical protein
LRILGRGMTRYDDMDHTKMGATSIRIFFRDFCEMMNAKMREKWIYLPKDEAEVRECMAPYEAAGFPGCWGSADCTHVAWDRCPAGMRHMYKRGDKETPTVVWNVICNNSRRVMSVSRAFAGTQCDKTISQNDETMLKLRSGELYKGIKFKLHTTTHSSKDCDTPYIITDGGYHKWPMLICAFVFNLVNRNWRLQLWSSRLGSLRKDAECCFGAIKARFRILKLPFMLHNVEDIDNVFVTCCILHNMTLKADGLEGKWHSAAMSAAGYHVCGDGCSHAHDGISGDHDEDLIGQPIRRRRQGKGKRKDPLRLLRDTDYSFVGSTPNFRYVGCEVLPGFEQLRDKLVQHFNCRPRPSALSGSRVYGPFVPVLT